jgi:hypothetical protein
VDPILDLDGVQTKKLLAIPGLEVPTAPSGQLSRQCASFFLHSSQRASVSYS